jgi:hypothetical protein
MGKKLSTYHSNNDKGWCEIHLDSKNESLYIEYFDEWGRKLSVEEFPDKSMLYVENAAENWALGIKKLEDI